MKINIELNMDFYEGILEKSHTYAHKIAGMIYNKSENYKNKHIISQININNFDVLGEENADTIRECRILDVKTNQIIDKQFMIYHVNLDKILKKYYNEYTKDEINDYINVIKCYNIKTECERIKAEMKKLVLLKRCWKKK